MGNGNAIDAQFGGVSIALDDAPDSSFEQMTVADNQAAAGAIGGVQCIVAAPLRNSIVWANQGDDAQISAACAPTYALVSGPVHSGAGNFSADPDFVDPAAGDYDIGPDSGAIDRGDPTSTGGSDIHGDPRRDGAMADLGADEYIP